MKSVFFVVLMLAMNSSLATVNPEKSCSGKVRIIMPSFEKDLLPKAITATSVVASSPLWIAINGKDYLLYHSYVELIDEARVGAGAELIEFTSAVKLKKTNSIGNVTKADVEKVAAIITSGDYNLKICGGGESYPSYNDLVEIVALDF